MFLYRKSASNGFVWLIWSCPKTCKAKQKKKKMFLVLISIKKKAGGRFFFFLSFGTFLTFPIGGFLYKLPPSPS